MGAWPLAEPSVLGPLPLALLQASLGPGQLLGPIVVFLFIVVIMKMSNERIALHCDVELELIC